MTYDISNNKRRTKLHDRLLDYGTPVQLSVFEIAEDCIDEAQALCEDLLKAEDSARLYHLCQRCQKSITLYGTNVEVLQDVDRPDVIEVPDAPPVSASRRKKASRADLSEPTLTKGDLEKGKLQATSRLMELICAMENLNEAFLDVKANRGCAGSDGVSIAAFDRHRATQLAHLQKELLEGCYRPRELKVFNIAKDDGGVRTLRVPSVRDRVAQQAVLRIINPVWEAEFESSSYAYRKGRSVKQAVKKVERYRDEGCSWVLRVDIDDYFDEIPHEALLNRFKQRNRDDQVVSLVQAWIAARGMPLNAERSRVGRRGIPQGSSVSPLLSNIYLDRFDEAILSLGYRMVRYADDFLIACRSEKDAHDALADVQRELRTDALQLNNDKTYIASFSKGFVFLGYVFQGTFTIKRKKLPAGWRVSGIDREMQDDG